MCYYIAMPKTNPLPKKMSDYPETLRFRLTEEDRRQMHIIAEHIRSVLPSVRPASPDVIREALRIASESLSQ